MMTQCPRCGGTVDGNPPFCTWCGAGLVKDPAGPGPQDPPPPSPHGPQYPVQGPVYAYPHPYPHPHRTDSRRTFASMGCSLLMVTAGLALPFVLLGFFVGFFAEGTLLLAGSLLAMVSGWMALRGIMPHLAIVGAALLVAGAVAIIPASGFGVVYVLIGLLMAIASLVLILMGFRDLTRRAETRARSPVAR